MFTQIFNTLENLMFSIKKISLLLLIDNKQLINLAYKRVIIINLVNFIKKCVKAHKCKLTTTLVITKNIFKKKSFCLTEQFYKHQKKILKNYKNDDQF